MLSGLLTTLISVKATIPKSAISG